MHTEHLHVCGVFEIFAVFCLTTALLLLMLGVIGTSYSPGDVVYKLNGTHDYFQFPVSLMFTETPVAMSYSLYSDNCAISSLEQFANCFGSQCQQLKVAFRFATFRIKSLTPSCLFYGHLRFFGANTMLI